ncbi:FKBP-type peptidyl-prolyl cis-trans isomerase [Methylosoma difficile]
MVPKVFALLAASSLCVSGCASQTPTLDAPQNNPPALDSYRLGVLHIQNIRENSNGLERQRYEQGLRDALDNRAASAIGNPKTEWQALARLDFAQVKTANLNAGKAFLAANQQRQSIVTLPSGVQYEVLKTGKNTRQANLDDTVGIVYKITDIEGNVKLDNSKGDVQKMYEMPIKKIYSKGWQEALQLMTAGSKWRLFIPAELAFGERGLSERGILPNETLIIENQLVRIIAPTLQ